MAVQPAKFAHCRLIRTESAAKNKFDRIGGIGLYVAHLLTWIDVAWREALLFAALGFVIGGIDDVAVDVVYLIRYVRRRLAGVRDLTLADLPPPGASFAIFVPTWRETEVIGPMLRAGLDRTRGATVRFYVAVYPNDPATLAAVEDVARDDCRVRLVVNVRAGPTTKADNLNSCWRALRADEAATGACTDAIVLHDAEDVIHPGELRVYAAWLTDHDAVQIPVVPLIDPHSRYVAGTYLDEFAEAHGKLMVVRQAMGAGLPFAGTGCAIRCSTLAAVAAERGGGPFDADTLTEDYELGLTLAATGARIGFAWVTEADRRTPVAVRAFFPGRFEAAYRQKARWMTGIALAGWDRIGWGRPTALADHWMRMRDRRAPVAMLVTFAAYLAFLLWAASYVVHAVLGSPQVLVDAWLGALLWAGSAAFGWRLAMRTAFVCKAEGWREGLRAIPRMLVGNLIALVAAQRALVTYVALLRGARLRWDKTTHHFPRELS